MAAQRREKPARDARHAREPAAAHRTGDERDGRPRDGASRAVHGFPCYGRLDGPLRRSVRHRVGHHGQLPVDRRVEEHEPCGGRPRHRRILVRNRARAGRGDPGGHRLQQTGHRFWALRRAARSLCQRIQRDPVAPARRAAVTMAASGLGGNGHRLPGRYRPMSEINVTPLVDVMLVLLVVFMVAAPLLTVGVPVDLPQTQAPPITEPKEPLVITINGEGRIFIQETEVPTESLIPRLEAITANNSDAPLYVRGDKAINYGRVVEVMSLVSAAGFSKVSLVAEAPKGAAGKAASAARAVKR